ncbi:50S ribosomal protein L18 [Candidatus Roizmanbacteria bacterium]|nr:MAG: 50S ribosomal protein L18 [Candidatus Roizmanbacteria bacterium]
MANKNLQRKLRRKRRVSSNIVGTKERPRVSVNRSNVHIYAQVIDDEAAKTLVAYDASKLEGRDKKTKTQEAKEVGVELAKLMKAKKITQVVFDRGSFAYKGRVKALAEGLREGGITV